MKKNLLVLLSIFLVSAGLVKAQAIATFETGTDGFSKGWGSVLLGVQKVADPTGKSGGVLELNLGVRKAEADGFKGAISKGGVDASTASLIGYNLWLPKGTPDSLSFAVWAGDKDWKWAEVKYYAKDVPKETWFPVYFNPGAAMAKDASWSTAKGPLAAMGLEFKADQLKGTDSTWTGKVYIDDVRLIGALPKTIATFEGNTDGYGASWGGLLKGVSQIADPTTKSAGVLQVELGTRKWEKDGFKAAVGKGGISGEGYEAVQYSIYLPKNTPDSLYFAVYTPDNSWTWAETKYFAKDIPKETWYPVTSSFAVAAANDPANWKMSEGAFAQLGIEFKADKLTGADTTWTGNILVDNVKLIGTNVLQKWVVADFQADAAGVQGFGKWYGNSLVSLSRADVDGRGVLKAQVDMSTSEHKAALSKGSVRIYSDTLKKAATEINVDVFLPADYAPVSGQVGLIVNGPSDSWNEQVFQIASTEGPTNIVPGKWTTLKADLTAWITSGAIKDPKQPATVGIQVYQSDGAYKGNILIDNLTVVGIPEPIAPVLSPKTTASVKTKALEAGGSFEYVSFVWEDNKLGSETYTIYASKSPITDIKGTDVKKIVADIPHGLQKYGYRPWTADGTKETYYFAITAFDGIKETPLADQAKVGPVTVTTSKTFKLKYVKDFGTKFVLDGQDDEFQSYKDRMIVPESGTYAVDTTQHWTLSNMDMNFKTTMIIDDKYLYISADVTDDDLRDTPTQQAWEGDALEFYMGFYDASKLYAPHAKNFQNSDGDWRIGFNALGNTTLGGTSPVTIKGVESTVYPKFTGDGYIIEARLQLDSMAANGKFQLSNNMMMPFRIDANDWDPNKGDTQRSLIVQVGHTPDADEDWKRPDAWAYLQVIDYTTGVADDNTGLPKVYALYNNYPNPFNPTTVIKFDLPKESKVTLRIFDVLGREVSTIVNQNMTAGTHMVNFNADKLSSGIYLYKIEAGNFVQTKKMMLVK